jgi:hypothetical protein
MKCIQLPFGLRKLYRLLWPWTRPASGRHAFSQFFLCWEYLKLLHSCALSLNYTEKFGRLRKATRTYGQTWLNYVKPLNLLEIPGTQAQQGVYPCLVALPWCFPHGRLLRLLRSLLQTWRWSASRRPQRKELGLKRVKRKRIYMNLLDPPDSESRWNILQWHIQHVIRSNYNMWLNHDCNFELSQVLWQIWNIQPASLWWSWIGKETCPEVWDWHCDFCVPWCQASHSNASFNLGKQHAAEKLVRLDWLAAVACFDSDFANGTVGKYVPVWGNVSCVYIIIYLILDFCL